MIIYLILSITLIFIGMSLIVNSIKKSKWFGVLNNPISYQDSSQFNVELLKAKTIPLVGKPDYLVKVKENIIPVEIKTGVAPLTPWMNHTMQLMAYCLLVEETYGKRPPGGYLKYKNREFKVAYTKEAEDSVRKLVNEILEKKKSGEELYCKHLDHN